MVGVLPFLLREPTINLKRQPLLALRHSANILPPPSVSSLPHRLPVDLIIKHNEFVMAYPVRKDEHTYAHAYSCVFPPHRPPTAVEGIRFPLFFRSTTDN